MRTIRTAEKRSAFLAGLAEGLSIRAAARNAGFSRRAAYEWRADDPEFAADWADAEEDGTDELEDIARARATSVSDVLLIFMLKARRPEKYRERSQVDVSGGLDLRNVPIADLRRELAELRAADQGDSGSQSGAVPGTEGPL